MTFGLELADDIRVSNSWPGLLKKELNVSSLVNDGEPGVSNLIITERLIGWISNRIALGYDMADVFVVIGWTAPTRYSFPMEYGWMTVQPDRDVPPGSRHEKKLLWRSYQNDFFDVHHDWFVFFQNVFLTQQFLKKHGINYLMFNSLKTPTRFIKERLENVDPFKSVGVLTDNIDRRRYMGMLTEEKMSFMEHLHELNYTNFAPGNHPLDDGHAIWTDVLMKHIERENLL